MDPRKMMGQTESGDWFDQQTGEVIEHSVAMIVPKKQRLSFREGWVAMSQQAMEVFQEIRSADQQRVLWSLLAVLDFENLIQVNQSEIAKSLGMQRPNVNRAVRALVKLGVILEGPKIGVSKTYRLNPHMGWKGSVRNHNQVLQDRMKQANMRVITSPADAEQVQPDPERQALENAGQLNWLD